MTQTVVQTAGIDTSNLATRNRLYWTNRSDGYSLINRGQLAGAVRDAWLEAVSDPIRGAYPQRAPEEIRVLDIGCGPGFFTILLSDAGFAVTGIDYTPAMLECARENARGHSGRMEFLKMNAEELDFPDESFDAVVSRNLTWDLPHPLAAYREWCRVLAVGGALVNFDANWYRYLFEADAKEAFEEDRARTRAAGFVDECAVENASVMEDIALEMPLSDVSRPAWDIATLRRLGMKNVCADEQIWKRVWDEQDCVNFASTPLFRVCAQKRG